VQKYASEDKLHGVWRQVHDTNSTKCDHSYKGQTPSDTGVMLSCLQYEVDDAELDIFGQQSVILRSNNSALGRGSEVWPKRGLSRSQTANVGFRQKWPLPTSGAKMSYGLSDVIELVLGSGFAVFECLYHNA
jgi:hypothetical protein